MEVWNIKYYLFYNKPCFINAFNNRNNAKFKIHILKWISFYDVLQGKNHMLKIKIYNLIYFYQQILIFPVFFKDIVAEKNPFLIQMLLFINIKNKHIYILMCYVVIDLQETHAWKLFKQFKNSKLFSQCIIKFN